MVLSGFLGPAIRFEVVDYELMSMVIPTSGCDQVTKHWPFHKRKGGRPVPADPRG